MKSYGSISSPLTKLFKMNEHFVWYPWVQSAFESLKTAMISPLVLALPNINETFVIETEALGHGLGAILSQNGHPLAFAGKALSPLERQLFVYERELLAFVFAVKQWHSYLSPSKIHHQNRPFAFETSSRTT